MSKKKLKVLEIMAYVAIIAVSVFWANGDYNKHRLFLMAVDCALGVTAAASIGFCIRDFRKL